MSHEELGGTTSATPRAPSSAVAIPGPGDDDVIVDAAVLAGARHDDLRDDDHRHDDHRHDDLRDDVVQDDGSAPRDGDPRRRRLAVTAAAVLAAGLTVLGGVHEVGRALDVRALESTRISVERASFDMRPVLYARLAGSPPSTRVPVSLRVVNHGSRPVRVLALQIGQVPVEPVAVVTIAAGASALVRGLALASCVGETPPPAKELSTLPTGRGAARVADDRGNRRTVGIQGWPSISARLPSGARCQEISWGDAPVRA